MTSATLGVRSGPNEAFHNCLSCVYNCDDQSCLQLLKTTFKHFILFSDKPIPLYDQKQALYVVQVSGLEL